MLFNYLPARGRYIIIAVIPCYRAKTFSPKRNRAKGSYNFEVVSYLCLTHVQKGLQDKGRMNNTKVISGREDTPRYHVRASANNRSGQKSSFLRAHRTI